VIGFQGILQYKLRDEGASIVGTEAERLLSRLRPGAALVTVSDSHPATLSWLGSVAPTILVPLGVDHFGQSGDIADLYRHHGVDAETIVGAALDLA
jgi:pyruvate dehydrogenase E1 component